MKTFTMGSFLLLAIILIASPIAAQDRSGGGDRGSAVAPSVSSVSDSRAASVSSSESSRDYSSGSVSSYNPISSPSSSSYSPSLYGTSFDSLRAYYSWQSYYDRLYSLALANSLYSLGFNYFNRFARNREPLITPEILKLTLREPLNLSYRMLASIDRLEELLSNAKEGMTVNKLELLERTKEIRDLAKDIRQNETLIRYDLRKNNSLPSVENLDLLSPESIAKLREMAIDLNLQLKNMYNLSSTSTISVTSFNEPSLASLAKGIEKLSKAIGSSSKKI